jgi:hypothetical protein
MHDGIRRCSRDTSAQVRLAYLADGGIRFRARARAHTHARRGLAAIVFNRGYIGAGAQKEATSIAEIAHRNAAPRSAIAEEIVVFSAIRASFSGRARRIIAPQSF